LGVPSVSFDFFVAKLKTFEYCTFSFKFEDSKKIANGHRLLKWDVTVCVNTFSYKNFFKPTSYTKIMTFLPNHKNDLKFMFVIFPKKYITKHNYILKDLKLMLVSRGAPQSYAPRVPVAHSFWVRHS
jgi:hypothetical protein